MSKKADKEVAGSVASKAVDIVGEQHKDQAALEAKIKELEAKVAQGEEGALARVCAAMDLEVPEVKAKEPKKEMMIRVDVTYPVNINGRRYLGIEEVPYSVFQVISQALGDRKQRILRELTGNNYILRDIQGGGQAPQIVGAIGMNGEPVTPAVAGRSA